VSNHSLRLSGMPRRPLSHCLTESSRIPSRRASSPGGHPIRFKVSNISSPVTRGCLLPLARYATVPIPRVTQDGGNWELTTRSPRLSFAMRSIIPRSSSPQCDAISVTRGGVTMNPRIEWWLTAQRRATAVQKDAPLWLIGVGLAVGYQALWHPRHHLETVFVMVLPQCIKLLIAIWLLGWRKATIPQDAQDSTFMFWLAVAGTILAIGGHRGAGRPRPLVALEVRPFGAASTKLGCLKAL
jgi:hypothetical protein